MKIWSKCDWYKHAAKSSKFFLNPEKSFAIQGQVQTAIYNDNGTKDETNQWSYLFFFQFFV